MATHTRSLMPKWLPAFNKRVTNPIQGLWAPYLPPYAMIHHVGRSSGRAYKSPVVAFRRGSQLYVNLLYGSDAQWVKNVLAAEGAEAVRLGRKLSLSGPEVVTGAEAGKSLPLGARLFGRNTGVLVLQIAGS